MDNELRYMAKKKNGDMKNDVSGALPEGSVGGGSELYLMTHESIEAVRDALKLETDVPPNIDHVTKEVGHMKEKRER